MAVLLPVQIYLKVSILLKRHEDVVAQIVLGFNACNVGMPCRDVQGCLHRCREHTAGSHVDIIIIAHANFLARSLTISDERRSAKAGRADSSGCIGRVSLHGLPEWQRAVHPPSLAVRRDD